MMEISVEQYNKMAERLAKLEYELDESVKVVRCKDCKYYESDGGALMTCTLTDLIVNDDDYCSFGERRE